jgi:uncharacterized protein
MTWPADWSRLVGIVLDLAETAALASQVHGPQHWRAVARVGVELARLTPGTDLGVVVLFALLHDSQRQTDGHDPDHGRRAATLAQALHAEGHIQLSTERLEALWFACAQHAKGYVIPEPSIGVAWDADRLNLWRVGVTPDPGMLSTEAARRPTIREWARQVHDQDPSWAEIHAVARGKAWRSPHLPRARRDAYPEMAILQF